MNSRPSPRPRTTIAVHRDDLPAWLPISAGVVYINGEPASQLVGGMTRIFHVLPGEHWVGVGIGMGPPNSIKVDLPLGGRIDLACGRKFNKCGGWSPWQWVSLVLWSLVLVLMAYLLAFPFLIITGKADWTYRPIYRFLESSKGMIYQVVYYLPVLDPIVSFLKSNSAWGLFSLLCGVCMLISLVVSFFAVRFFRGRFVRSIYLHEIATEIVSLDPLALTETEVAEPMTNECVLAALKARESRQIHSRSSWDPLESEPSKADI